MDCNHLCVTDKTPKRTVNPILCRVNVYTQGPRSAFRFRNEIALSVQPYSWILWRSGVEAFYEFDSKWWGEGKILSLYRPHLN